MAENDHNDDIEDRVLQAAKELLVHYGYDKTTMNDIAQKAGVAKSTIYLHWKKKEALFDALIIREGQSLTNGWFARVEADPKGGTFPALYRHGLEMLLENDFLLAIYRRDRQILGGLIKRIGIADLYLQRQKMLMSFFSSLQAVGVARADIDALTLAYLLNSIQFGLIEMGSIIPEEYSPDVDHSLKMIVDIIENYVTPEDGGDSEAGKKVLGQLKQEIDTALEKFNQK
jgi:AcrR family transcriptional regulator